MQSSLRRLGFNSLAEVGNYIKNAPMAAAAGMEAEWQC